MPEENKPNHIFDASLKVYSGRFIMTVMGAISFAVIVFTICSILRAKAAELAISDITPILSSVLLVIGNVFTFYFVKNSMGSKEIKPKE